MVKPKHIVVLEDKPVLRRLTEVALESAGNYKITQTESYEDAVTALRIYNADLLVIQHGLDGCRAPEMIRQIRGGEIGGNRNIPIIVLTDPARIVDHLGSSDADLLGSVQGTAVVSEPLSIRKLIPAVLRALDPQAGDHGTITKSGLAMANTASRSAAGG